MTDTTIIKLTELAVSMQQWQELAWWIRGILLTLILGGYTFTLIIAMRLFARMDDMQGTMLSKDDIHQLSGNVAEVSKRLDSLISAILTKNISINIDASTDCLDGTTIAKK
jgi:hypothetical protein